MKNYSIIKHLTEASFDISEMISMVSKNANCVKIISKSKDAQLKIQTAKNLMLSQYLKKFTAELSKYNKQEKVTEIMKINKYR